MVGPVEVKRENASLLVAIRHSRTPGFETASGKKTSFPMAGCSILYLQPRLHMQNIVCTSEMHYFKIIIMLPEDQNCEKQVEQWNKGG